MVVEFLIINLSEDSFNHLLIFISIIFKFKRKNSIPISYVLTFLSSISIKLLSFSIWCTFNMDIINIEWLRYTSKRHLSIPQVFLRYKRYNKPKAKYLELFITWKLSLIDSRKQTVNSKYTLYTSNII